MHRKLFRSSPTRHRSRSSSTHHSLAQTTTLDVQGSSSDNNISSRSKSRSKSREKDTKTTRRSPISFRIRDKKEYRYKTNDNMSTSISTINLSQSQSLSESHQLDNIKTAFDPWSSNSPEKGGRLSSISPASVTDSFFQKQCEKSKSTSTNYQYQFDHQSTTSTRSTATNSYSISTTSNSNSHTNNASSTNSNKNNGYSSSNGITSGYTITSTSQKRIIPGVSKMTMRQTLAVIFSAFWERADLYTDVLALEHDKPSQRQLRLAFFRQGRKVLATPIESPDDMTTLSMGVKPIFAVGGGTSKCEFSPSGNNCGTDVVQSGVKVSRKAKMKFQAINLAYDLLNDESKRNLYDEWRLWHCRLPPPSSPTSTTTEARTDPEQLQIHYQKQLRIQKEKHLQIQQYQQKNDNMNQYQSFSKMINKSANAAENNGSGGGYSNRNSNKSSKSGSTKTQYDLIESSSSSPTSTISKHHNGNPNDESSTSDKSNLISLPSILKEPTFGKKKKKKRHSKSHQHQYGYGTERKITWNEEVEELVIMECSRDDNSTVDMEQQYTSFESRKENIEPLDNEYKPNIPDPYSNSSIKDNWFRSSNEDDDDEPELPPYEKGKSKRKTKKKDRMKLSIDNFRRNDKNPLASKADADSLEPGPVSFNFHSLDDSTVTFVDSSQQQRIQLNALDDSLVEILDTHTPIKSSMGDSSHKQRQIMPNSKDSPGLVGSNTYVVEGNQNNNVKINVRTYQKDTIPKQAFQSVSDSDVVDLFQKHREATSYELDPEDISIDTRSTKDTQGSYNWKPFTSSSSRGNSCSPTNADCSVFGSTKECMFRETDCGAVDVGKGFQATLSNYINAVVTDMKEGLNNIGKKWEENKAKMSEGENPFFLNSFELDAMMDILKIEMNNLSPAVDDIKSFSAPKCGPQLQGNKYSCTS